MSLQCLVPLPKVGMIDLTKGALARWRNLFPAEQLLPVEHLGPAKAVHRRKAPYEK